MLGPGPADVPFQFPKENTRKRLGCAMKYHHYVIMMLPFFLKIIDHYSPPCLSCFPSPLFTLPTNQLTIGRPALRLAQIQRQAFFQRTAADDSDSSVLLKRFYKPSEKQKPICSHLFTNIADLGNPATFLAGWYFPSENSNGLKC